MPGYAHCNWRRRTRWSTVECGRECTCRCQSQTLQCTLPRCLCVVQRRTGCVSRRWPQRHTPALTKSKHRQRLVWRAFEPPHRLPSACEPLAGADGALPRAHTTHVTRGRGRYGSRGSCGGSPGGGGGLAATVSAAPWNGLATCRLRHRHGGTWPATGPRRVWTGAGLPPTPRSPRIRCAPVRRTISWREWWPNMQRRPTAAKGLQPHLLRRVRWVVHVDRRERRRLLLAVRVGPCRGLAHPLRVQRPQSHRVVDAARSQDVGPRVDVLSRRSVRSGSDG